jgi:hypothetical protein
MSQSNGSHNNPDLLHPSSQDEVALCDAVRVRFGELSQAYLANKGRELLVPKTIKAEFIRVARMADRHEQGDFRNSHSEMRALKIFAQWTVDIQMRLRQQPRQIVQWSE